MIEMAAMRKNMYTHIPSICLEPAITYLIFREFIHHFRNESRSGLDKCNPCIKLPIVFDQFRLHVMKIVKTLLRSYWHLFTSSLPHIVDDRSGIHVADIPLHIEDVAPVGANPVSQVIDWTSPSENMSSVLSRTPFDGALRGLHCRLPEPKAIWVMWRQTSSEWDIGRWKIGGEFNDSRCTIITPTQPQLSLVRDDTLTGEKLTFQI